MNLKLPTVSGSEFQVSSFGGHGHGVFVPPNLLYLLGRHPSGDFQKSLLRAQCFYPSERPEDEIDFPRLGERFDSELFALGKESARSCGGLSEYAGT